MTISLKKNTKVKGYQIQTSMNKKFKKGVKNTLTKKSSVTFKKLKSKKTYYVRARAYVLNDAGKKIYGKWCIAKKVKVK